MMENVKEFIHNMVEPVFDFFWYDLRRGFKNLWKWTPIIWKDRDWDYIYLYILMEKKLSNMCDSWSVDDYEKAGDDLKDMKDVRDALRRLIAGNYIYEDYNRITKKWKPEGSSLNYYDSFSPEDREAWSKDMTAIFNKEEELRAKDISTVFDTMKSKSRYWWS